MADKAIEKAKVMKIFDDLVEPSLDDKGIDPDSGAPWAEEREEVEQRLSALIESYPPGQVLTHIYDTVCERYEIHYPATFIEQEIRYLEDPKAWV